MSPRASLWSLRVALGSLVSIAAACGPPPVKPNVIGPPTRAPDAGARPPAVLVSTRGCASGTVQALAEGLPPTSSCVVSGSDPVVHGIFVKTADGEAFAVHAFGGKLRVHVRETDHDWLVESQSPIEFSGWLARAPQLRTSRSIPVGGVATLREGAIVEGTASGVRVNGKVSLEPWFEISPISVACTDLRLLSNKDLREGEVSLAGAMPTQNVVSVSSTDPIPMFPTATSEEAVRVSVRNGFLEKLRAVGPRSEVRLRTHRGDELRGWVASGLLQSAEGAGFGYGRGTLCGCPDAGAKPTVRILPGTKVYGKAGGAAWGTVREGFVAAIDEAAARGERVRIVASPSYSEEECVNGALEHFWVEHSAALPITAPAR